MKDESLSELRRKVSDEVKLYNSKELQITLRRLKQKISSLNNSINFRKTQLTYNKILDSFKKKPLNNLRKSENFSSKKTSESKRKYSKKEETPNSKNHYSSPINSLNVSLNNSLLNCSLMTTTNNPNEISGFSIADITQKMNPDFAINESNLIESFETFNNLNCEDEPSEKFLRKLFFELKRSHIWSIHENIDEKKKFDFDQMVEKIKIITGEKDLVVLAELDEEKTDISREDDNIYFEDKAIQVVEENKKQEDFDLDEEDRKNESEEEDYIIEEIVSDEELKENEENRLDEGNLRLNLRDILEVLETKLREFKKGIHKLRRSPDLKIRELISLKILERLEDIKIQIIPELLEESILFIKKKLKIETPHRSLNNCEEIIKKIRQLKGLKKLNSSKFHIFDKKQENFKNLIKNLNLSTPSVEESKEEENNFKKKLKKENIYCYPNPNKDKKSHHQEEESFIPLLKDLTNENQNSYDSEHEIKEPQKSSCEEKFDKPKPKILGNNSPNLHMRNNSSFIVTRKIGGLNQSFILPQMNEESTGYISDREISLSFINGKNFQGPVNKLNENIATIPRENLDELRIYNYFWTPRYLRTGVSSFPYSEEEV